MILENETGAPQFSEAILENEGGVHQLSDPILENDRGDEKVAFSKERSFSVVVS